MRESFPIVSDAATRIRRARMRAWRRGMREMDLILGGFFDAHGSSMGAAELTTFELLMARRDQDLYEWISGRRRLHPDDATSEECAMIERIVEGCGVFEKNSP